MAAFRIVAAVGIKPNASESSIKEVPQNVQNLSAQKASAQEGAWLQKENEDS